jgi:adenylyltransferase/sulfurtransferase
MMENLAPLQHAHVLIVGAGGLGCPVSWHLAAAGVGRLTIIDPDAVELSNLNRQILYRTDDIGRAKVTVLAARIADRFPHTAISAHREPLTEDNLAALFAPADFIVDATDGVAVKFLINDGAVAVGRPFSHAGILGLQGQTLTVLPGRSACLRCLFPEPPQPDTVPTCQEAGILGAVAGVIGSVQANEVIKYLVGNRHASTGRPEGRPTPVRGTLLTNRLLTFDGLAQRWRGISVTASAHCPLERCRERVEHAREHARP